MLSFKAAISAGNKLIFFLTFLWILPAAAETIPVQIQTGAGGERAGVFVSQAGNCVVLTAAHDLTDLVMSIAFNGKRADAQRVWTGTKAKYSLDLAILRITSPVDVSCNPLATQEQIGDALTQPYGQIWLRESNREVRTITVSITQRTDSELWLLQEGANSRAITEGASGAPVVFGGRIVAILSGNTATELRATRLDYLLQVAGNETHLRSVDAVAARRFAAYDLDQLADAVANEARKARDMRRDVERTARLASDVEHRADEAARFAADIPMGQVKDGHSRYRATNGKFYAGQVITRSSWLSSDITIKSNGYGVSIVEVGDYRGEIVKCAFKMDVGCVGPFVKFYADRSGTTWKRIESEWEEGKLIHGPAKLYLLSGEIIYAPVTSKENNDQSMTSSYSGSGVIEFPDGRRYEGQLNGQGGNGLGVFWNADGSLIRQGRWVDGNAVD